MPLSQEQVKFWQAQDLGKLDLLRATYIKHTFSRHTHNGYAIGVIERGAETFYYRGGVYTAPAGSMVVINPGEVHTGQALDKTGWTYRMLYPEVSLVRRAAQEVSGNHGGVPDFPTPVIWDNYLVGLIRNLHTILESSNSALERESCFISTLVQLVTRHADGFYRWSPSSCANYAVRRAREYLEAHYVENVSLAELADVVNLSSFHFLRVFRKTMGLPPHAYLNQVRVERAKTLLTQGCPISYVAAETGFVDQSHFSRRFKRIVGVTPGQFSRK